MNPPTLAILAFCLILFINVITYWAFEKDKELARHNQWRTKESTLIVFCFLGGGLGGHLAMKHLHHKTSKLKFKILVPLSILVWILLLGLVIYGQWS